MNYTDIDGHYEAWHTRNTRTKDRVRAGLIALAMLVMVVIALSGLWLV